MDARTRSKVWPRDIHLKLRPSWQANAWGCSGTRAPIVETVASLFAPSSDAALPTTGLPIDALIIGTLNCDATEGADLPTPSSEASKKDKVSV